MTRRVLVTGSRDWVDRGTVRDALAEHMRDGDVLVHGAARGLDVMARDVWEAELCDVPGVHECTEAWPADWDTHGRAAGPIRNQKMVDSRPDLCLAFVRNASRGAMDCLGRAWDIGIPVVVYERTDR